jgi:hypothetical protein
LLGSLSAAPIVIPSSSAFTQPLFYPVNGLYGYLWLHPNGDDLKDTYGANEYMRNNPFDARFIATELHYPRTGGTADTVEELLGPDAATLSGPVPGVGRPATIWLFQGLMHIQDWMDADPDEDGVQIEFSMGSDDASRLLIADERILTVGEVDAEGTERGVFDGEFYRQWVTFESAGLYPVEVKWWDWYGGIFLHLYSSAPGEPTGAYEPGDLRHFGPNFLTALNYPSFGYPSDEPRLILPPPDPTPDPAPMPEVPEPGGFVMAGLGAALIVVRYLRVSRQTKIKFFGANSGTDAVAKAHRP